MTDLLVRDIDPELKQFLHAEARRNGRSLSAETQAILAQHRALVAGHESSEKGLGTQLVELFRGLGGDDLNFQHDDIPSEPPDFR